MKVTEFEKHVKELLKHSDDLLIVKAREYATEDRLANFKQPCSMMGANPAEVCLWYDMKHISSMVKIAQDINKGVFPSKELLQEKCTDYLNYGFLFYANVMEMLEEQKDAKSLDKE